MSFKINCPHCTKALNVTEPAFGKTVPCPGCNQPIKVPYPAQPTHQANQPTGGLNENAALNSANPLPPGMPPMPAGDPSSNGSLDPFAFVQSHAAARHAGKDTGRHESAGGHDPASRPAGVVWLVLYWGFAGVTLIVTGSVVSAGASFLNGMAHGLEGPFRNAGLQSILAAELIGMAGLLLFHFGLLLELACYGLWTFRTWALPLARLLAVLQVAGALLGFVIAVVARTAILANITSLAVSMGIVIYLLGSKNLTERVQQAINRVRPLDDHTWERYESRPLP